MNLLKSGIDPSGLLSNEIGTERNKSGLMKKSVFPTQLTMLTFQDADTGGIAVQHELG